MTASQIINGLDKDLVREYLANVLVIMYGSVKNAPLDSEKDWSPDTLDALSNLLGGLVE